MTLVSISEGDVIAGKYRVDRVLGEGGMGVVLAARHLQLDERIAIKLMRPEFSADREATERFLREARAAVKLKSEHVARINDVGKLDTGAPFIVMEYLEGTDLSDMLDARKVLPLSEACDYVLQACDAVAEAHSIGIVHRDLKPANLFATRRPDGTPLVKVLDFGISKSNAFQETPDRITSTRAMMGSPYYMAPEQMVSTRNVDSRADVWSLGIILYQLTTGYVPFTGETLGELMSIILQQDAPEIRTLRPDLPPDFAAIVHECLQKEKAKRCKSIAALARRLAPYAPANTRMLAERISTVLRSIPPSRHVYPSSGAQSLPRIPAASSPSWGQNAAFAQAPSSEPTGPGSSRGWTPPSSPTFGGRTLDPQSASTVTVAARRAKAQYWFLGGVPVFLLIVGLALIGQARRAGRPAYAPPAPLASAAPTTSTDAPSNSVERPAEPQPSSNATAPETDTQLELPATAPPTSSGHAQRPAQRPSTSATSSKVGPKPSSAPASSEPPKSLLDDRN